MGWLATLASGERRSSALHPRDPALADWLGAGAATAAGVAVTPANARACPEVDACIGLIEDTVATVPLDLFERTGEATRERRPEHPLHALLHERPNAWQTSAEFRQMMEGWRQTWGNAYARIVWRGDGVPEALEPTPPAEVTPFRAPSGASAYRWSPPGGAPRTLLAMEVLHLRDRPAKSHNMLEGDSKVERHREAIGRAQATGEYLSRFFSNNAVPKTFVEVPGELDALQQEQLREQFERRHGGLAKAHRLGILQAGMKLNTVGVDNDKAQVAETYQLAVAQIARIWGIPLHLIGETAKSTSWGTGIEQQSIGFIVYYMRPKFVVWEQALNAALMSAAMRRRFYFEFNVDGLLRGDFKSRMDGYALMVQWGLATPNEIRRQMNLPPLDGGDERLHPLNMAPASRIMDVLMRDQSGKQIRVADLDADALTRALAALVAAGKGNGKLQEHQS